MFSWRSNPYLSRHYIREVTYGENSHAAKPYFVTKNNKIQNVRDIKIQGPVIQSTISLTSLLMTTG